MKLVALVLTLCVVLPGPALAAPGDPRLIQGALEWPPVLSGAEPFIVLRGDDGVVYQADVMAAQRHAQGVLAAGSRITLLGLEGTKHHEIIAVALGSGDAAALSFALAQGRPTTPAPPAPSSTAPAAVVPPAPTAPAAAAPPASTAPAAVVAPPAPAAALAAVPPVRVEAGRPARAEDGTTTAHPAPSRPPSTAPAGVALTAPTVAPAPVPPMPAAAPAAVPPMPAAAPAAVPPARREAWPARGEDGRWITVRGSVYAVAGPNLFVRRDDGRVVVVDISQLDPSTGPRLRLGTLVTVVAVPVGNKYQATGFIEQETSTTGATPAKPTR